MEFSRLFELINENLINIHDLYKTKLFFFLEQGTKKGKGVWYAGFRNPHGREVIMVDGTGLVTVAQNLKEKLEDLLQDVGARFQ